MKLIAEYPVGTLRNATTVNNVNSVAVAIKTMPGVGKPFLIFASLPGTVVMADFGMYPDYVVSSDTATNVGIINDQLATPPLDAITI